MPYLVPENVTSMTSWFTYLNTITDEKFVMVMMITFFFVMYISFKSRYETERALATSLGILSLICVLFFVMGMLNWLFTLGTILLSGIIIFVLYFMTRES